MKRRALVLAALAAFAAFAATVGPAAASDEIFIASENLTGGENVEGWSIYLAEPTPLIPGMLAVGEFDLGPISGLYFYFPASNEKQFFGVYIGASFAMVNGRINPQGLLGSLVLYGFNGIDGVHIITDEAA